MIEKLRNNEIRYVRDIKSSIEIKKSRITQNGSHISIKDRFLSYTENLRSLIKMTNQNLFK